MHITYITEQCGARWSVTATGMKSVFTPYWVFLVEGKSAAKPHIVGFYARSIEAACDALNN
jgi:hypothetical protein